MQSDFLFETSWEVCNKVGGIHTVVSTKAKTLVEKFKDNYMVIGPDIWKDTKANPEFEEDKYILKSWRAYAESKGLRIRIGRWDIQGEPIVILVDFTTFFSEKDRLFSEFWEEYGLDSITGAWDYVEPFLFGYASAKVIESFYEFYLSSQDKIVTQWHEWMTGSGLLYLKKSCPQIATCFTTHATVIGRSIAGNNLPLYAELYHYDANAISNEFNIRAKFSLEDVSAHMSDCFTTVSKLTNEECRSFFRKEVDVVTPNGFEPTFVPSDDVFEQKRLLARQKVFDVAQAITNQKIDDDAYLIINSGRYEFKNKGIDVFINAMGELNKKELDRQIIAVIAVPAHTTDIYRSMLERMGNQDFNNPTSNQYLTHHLFDPEHDPILKAIKDNALNNSPSDSVKIIFIPCYLNGEDGIVNLSYFDFLIGFDLSVFPSYYEPWGYTPMESMAFHIPSITTTLAGYGLWIEEMVKDAKHGSAVVIRNDTDTLQTTHSIVDIIEETLFLSSQEMNKLREKAFEIAKSTLWENLIDYYYQSYEIALLKAEARFDLYSHKQPINLKTTVHTNWGVTPSWKKIMIKPKMPSRLEGLHRLTQNIWWSWNIDACDLLRSINPERFEELEHNPIRLLESLSKGDIDLLLANYDFLSRLDSVLESFDAYMNEKENKTGDLIAYFSMEFGLHDSIKIFSGGLGMLAGDYLKEASDSNKNIIGIGLLYHYGYFNQKITRSGEQISEMFPQKFSHLPIRAIKNSNGEWIKISLALPGRIVYARVWCCDVGRVPLYLLDTDTEDNELQDRTITHQLYGGDWENRLKQEMLLGIAGVRLISTLGLEPLLYHSNEGHSAFNSLERLNDLIHHKKMSYPQAKEIVSCSTLFTTHTPVPAGHDAFSEDLMRVYMSHYTDRLGISWEEFMGLGRVDKNDSQEKFSMSILALNFSQQVNGVSKIHGKVSREMFVNMYPGYFPSEIHIDYVTNGVHKPTWINRQWSNLYDEVFSKEYNNDQSNVSYWEKIYNVDDKTIWDIHKQAKEELGDFVLERLEKELLQRAENPKLFIQTKERFSTNSLTFGFARRFATYKRAHLLFTDMERLEKIVNNPKTPVQFLFAGKAHPADKAGQDLIKNIIEVSKRPEFIGKIIFIENYDMHVAKHLVSGVDVWLNTPTRPLEASGTSGEKAVMNGVVNFSVLDGWWAEGWSEGAGWMLPEKQVYESGEYQNALDAEMIYETIENDIVPAYYNQDQDGVSSVWVSHIKNTIAKIAPRFTMKRQIDEYYQKFYINQASRTRLLLENNAKLARDYAAWKHRMRRAWNGIELIDFQIPHIENDFITIEDEINIKVILHINDISSEHIGVEVVAVRKQNNEIKELYKIYPLELISCLHSKAEYGVAIRPNSSGVFDYSIRIYPKNPLMPHRMDLPLVKWI